MSPTPEAVARDEIDRQLAQAGRPRRQHGRAAVAGRYGEGRGAAGSVQEGVGDFSRIISSGLYVLLFFIFGSNKFSFDCLFK